MHISVLNIAMKIIISKNKEFLSTFYTKYGVGGTTLPHYEQCDTSAFTEVEGMYKSHCLSVQATHMRK
jgi:hypothetical protein